jgi:hypothetical protein
LLAEHQPRWQGRASYLYADSGSSAGKYLNRIEQAGFTRWSISYNKWTDTLDRRIAPKVLLPGRGLKERLKHTLRQK